LNKTNFTLERIGENDFDLIEFIYKCQINESEKEKSTVWPVISNTMKFDQENFKKFIPNLQKALKSRVYYVLIEEQNNNLLGFLQLSEYNSRNQSAEIGFYFPKENRRKGLGKILIKLFLDTVFNGKYFWKINKIYGETCEINEGSIKLFESFDFHLDGVMRQHYWFGEKKINQLIFSILKEEHNK